MRTLIFTIKSDYVGHSSLSCIPMWTYLSREALLSTHADSAYEMSTIAYHQILESAGVDTSRQ